MISDDELRRLADASRDQMPPAYRDSWYAAATLIDADRIEFDEDAQFIAAASPATILHLLDRLRTAEARAYRDGLIAMARRLAVWQDGQQVVGPCADPLESVIAAIRAGQLDADGETTGR